MIDKRDIVHRQFVSSYYNKVGHGDVVIVKEKLRLSDNTIVPNIRIMENPNRKFYVTKQMYRNHKKKKSYEYIEKLDEIVTPNYLLTHNIKKALHSKANHWISLLNSPYLYGADISIEALIKMSYLDKVKDNPVMPLDIGYLDIEVDMTEKNYLDDNTVIISSFSHNMDIYTGFLKHLMYREDPKTKNMVPFTLEDVKRKSEEVYHDLTKEHGFTFNYKVFETEKELITWTFETINKNNTDFIGIWNMGFDIPHMLKRFRPLNISEKIISNDEIPDRHKNCWYVKDNYNTQHFSLKWDWFHTASGTQFLNGLSLYSNLRKTSGYEAYYTLDYILNKNIGLKKISLGKEESHVIMQRKRFDDYIIYNQFDVMGPMIMEQKNQDILQLYKRSEANLICTFSKMIHHLKNNLFYFFKKQGKIISSTSPASSIPFEDKFWSCECGNLTTHVNASILCPICETKVKAKVGGAVLPPSKCIGVGIKMVNQI